jgi:phage tail sheath protein FI
VLAVQQALVAHCEARRDRIGLIDVPAADTPDRASLVAWRDAFDTSYAALYHPWVSVVDPLAGAALVRAIPPSGHVAGVIARTDLAGGCWVPPANAELDWAQGLTVAVDTGTQAVLNPLGINCLRAFGGRGLRVYGARTLSSDALLRYVNVRRLLAMIETAIGQGTQWAVFEPNDAYLQTLLRVSIASFLRGLWQQGAFVGATEDEAYLVQCDDSTNPPDQVDLGMLVCLVGVAPVQPAEFVVLRVARIDGSLEVTDA